MDTQQILIIALRNFLQSGSNLLNNLDNSQLAFEFLDNCNKIRNYIFDKYYHNDDLREYYYSLPKVQPGSYSLDQESHIEKFVYSNRKIQNMMELFGLTGFSNKEKARNELMATVSNINEKTRVVLDKIDPAN